MYSDQKQEVRVHIRWMIRRDMPEVLAIENECFEYPWSENDFVNCLRQRNCIGMVAEHDDRVVGFMIYELHKTRIHVLNFVVAKDCQRQGVGSQMIAKLSAKLSAQRRSRIVLEVRETNLSAQLFFRAADSARYRCCAVITPIRRKTPTLCNTATARKKLLPKPPTALRAWPDSGGASKTWIPRDSEGGYLDTARNIRGHFCVSPGLADFKH